MQARKQANTPSDDETITMTMEYITDKANETIQDFEKDNKVNLDDNSKDAFTYMFVAGYLTGLGDMSRGEE